MVPISTAQRTEALEEAGDDLLLRQVAGEAVGGQECKEVLRDCGTPDYKQKLDAQLDAMANSEMWKAGAVCRSLRPHEKARESKVGTAGRKTN